MPAALAHLLVVGDDGALVEEARERLAEIDQPHVAERLDEEAGVEQVHHGVLGAAGVDVHRHPLLDHSPGRRPPWRSAG